MSETREAVRNRATFATMAEAQAVAEPHEYIIELVNCLGVTSFEMTAMSDHDWGQRDHYEQAGANTAFLDLPHTALALMALSSVPASPEYPLVEYVGTYDRAGTLLTDAQGLADWLAENEAKLTGTPA